MSVSHSYKFSRSFSTDLLVRTLHDVKSLLTHKTNPVIVDKQVFELYPELFDILPDSRLLKLSAGEQTKSLDTVRLIYDFLADNKVDRDTIIVVIGGGTITDLAAYAVSTYKRGCRLLLIPSTLLGMIDASLGGKTAVNYHSIKNLIGSFYPAEQVLLVPELLLTLSPNEIKNGLAEMLKLRFIIPDLPEFSPDVVISENAELIFEYANAKLNICSQDLNDMGQRRLLNLGHTFGHALESYSNYSEAHGEAVAWGIATAARLSERLKLIDIPSLDLIINTLKRFGFKTELETSIKTGFLLKLPELIRQDKKVQDNNLTLILFKESGIVSVCEHISLNTVISHLEEGKVI